MPGTPLIPLLTTIDRIDKHPDHYFDEIYLLDKNKLYVDLLKSRISKLMTTSKTNVIVEKNTFANVVKKIFPGCPPAFNDRQNDAYLVVLDPYGFQVDWENLKWIAQSGAVDFIITFHTRLASWNQNKTQSSDALTRMFGNDSWLNCENEDDFIKLYCNRIESIPTTWRRFTTKTLTVGRGNGKYHLICASRSPGASNVFDDIQKKFDTVDNELLTRIFDTTLGDQEKMDHFF